MTTVAWVPTRRSVAFEDLAIQRALGERVQALRLERGLTQEDLVDRSGLDRSHIARIEAGTINPSLRTIGRIARGLRVDLADLFRNV